MAEPDGVSLADNIVNYVGGKLDSEGTLHVDVRPFEREEWPPDSQKVGGEVVLSVPFLGNGGRLSEAVEVVRTGLVKGEIDVRGFTVTEASGSQRFNEDHPDLGRLLSESVLFTVEPKSGASEERL